MNAVKNAELNIRRLKYIRDCQIKINFEFLK